MKTLLIAALSLSALTPSRDADACGGYIPEPRVLRLSTHFLVGSEAAERTRSFALLGTATPSAKLTWRHLAPMSYDATQIANDVALANPFTFTLVGPSGTRVVTSNKHVFLSRSWDFERTTSAIDVGDAQGFAIAIQGRQTRAKWIALAETSGKPRLHAWVTALGVTPSDADAVYVNRVGGTEIEAVSVFPKGGKKMITFVKHGDRNLGRYEGSALGAFTNDGVTKLVLADGATVSTVFLPAS